MPKISQQLRALPGQLRDTKLRNLREAGELLEAELQRTLSKPGGPKLHSRPGEAPYLQSGRLRASAYATVDPTRGVLSWGANTPYAGIVNKTRPFLKITWQRAKVRVFQILARG